MDLLKYNFNPQSFKIYDYTHHKLFPVSVIDIDNKLIYYNVNGTMYSMAYPYCFDQLYLSTGLTDSKGNIIYDYDKMYVEIKFLGDTKSTYEEGYVVYSDGRFLLRCTKYNIEDDLYKGLLGNLTSSPLQSIMYKWIPEVVGHLSDDFK